MSSVQMYSKYRKQPTIQSNAEPDTAIKEHVNSAQYSKYGTVLPEGLQGNMEAAFGHNFSNVNIVENSNEAVNMKALAFTKGDNVHFAPGQYNPNSEKGKNLIGHEFTHIVQQRSGNVKANAKMAKGIALNTESSFEKEADNFGKKAVKGEKVTKYSSAGSQRMSAPAVQKKAAVVQMAKQTSHYGDFKDESFTTIKDAASKAIGVDMFIKFKPNKNVNAELIGMVQTVRSVETGIPFAINNDPVIKKRMITAADAKSISSPVKNTDEGIQIDQNSATDYRNPLYATGKISNSDTKLSEATTSYPVAKRTAAELSADTKTGINYKGWGDHGYRYKKGGAWKEKSAELHDAPKLLRRTKNAEQLFETTALGIKGNQKGIYYGSVQWGWRTDASGKFTKIPFSIQSQGTPSSTFIKAAEIWNKGKDAGGNKNISLPAPNVQFVKNLMGVQIGLGPVFTQLPFGSRVIITKWGMFESEIRVADGMYTGMTGKVLNNDLMDER